jgi:hypothetical protein
MEFICLEDNEYGQAGAFVPANENGQRVPNAAGQPAK